MVIFNKLPTWYADGTATVAANGTDVTGTGTVWTSLQPGDLFGVHKGLAVPILSVNSATSLTLAFAWPGTAQTNATYCVQLTPRSVGVQEATRQLLLMLANGNLDSFASLVGANGDIPMFSGAGVLTKLASTALGRGLLTASTSAAAYGALGEIPNAQLPTRVRELSPAVTDADTVMSNGFYAVAPTAANIPEAVAGTLIVSMYTATTYGVQIYVRLSSSTNNIWYRARSAGAWLPWNRIPNFGTDNIIPDASLPPQISQFPGTATRPTDADDFRRFGVVQVTNTTLNIPVATAGVLFNVPYDNGTLRQIFWPNNADTAYHRRRAGTWQTWKRFDGDLSGPAAAVTANAFTGFNGTTGYLTKALTTLEALGNLGPVFGGVAPEPQNANVGMVSGDFDTLIYPGVYTVAGSWINGAAGAGSSTYVGIIEVQARVYNNFYVQIFRYSNGAVYKRYASAGPTWTAWIKTETSVPSTTVAGQFAKFADVNGNLAGAPIVGTVTQSGGLPTGAIIESGSNANGSYTRFADGTQICYMTVSYTGSGAGVRTANITYPIAFSAPPTLIGGARDFGGSFRFIGPTTATIPANASASSVGVEVTAGGAGTVNAFIMVIGRWF